jgi:Na+/H+ antiporter NhaD/arsenite permease-like protein
MINYLKKEKVLCIAWILAIASMLLVPPDKEYMGYIDVRVLALLFCLMLIVKGFQTMGLFEVMIHKMFAAIKTTRGLSMQLVLMCFFMSMLITNDVALITFVPFAIMALNLCGRERLVIPVVVLQTMAANLGSMFTPIGNPQNLYLFSVSGIGLKDFFRVMGPVTMISFILLVVAVCFMKNEPIQMQTIKANKTLDQKKIMIVTAGFIVNLLVVFRVLEWPLALVITIAGIVLIGRISLLRQVDYGLLLTFVGFFIFVGNVGRIPVVHEVVGRLLQGREILISVLFSQFLSNVPAAILLSGFTQDVEGLLIGTNVGGLGTIIASMASLISYKIYGEQKGAEKGKYMMVFTVGNIIGLVILLVSCLLIY